MSHHCYETIEIDMSGDPEDDYETLVTKAMVRAKKFLPGLAVHRDEEEAASGDWFVLCGHTEVSPGGQQLSGHFTVARCK